MALSRDLSHLPRADEGLAPDATFRFADVLVEKWAKENEAEGDKPHAIDGTRFRHSDAGKCARLLGYRAAGIAASDPMDLSGVNNTRLGTVIHDLWQEALADRYPGAEIEVKVRTDGADGSGHVDAVVRSGGHTTAIELKTVGGYAFKAAIGRARKGMAAEGPKAEHLYQAALNAQALDADEAVVVYVAKEALSKTYRVDDERQRFLAEWTLTREQYEPLAVEEAERVAGIVAVVDGGELPRRIVAHSMPPGAEIVDPSKGTWEQSIDGEVADTGRYWGCDYCSHQQVCIGTKAGRIPVTSVPVDPFEGLPGSEVA